MSSYMLDAQRSILGNGKDFSLLHGVQIGTGSQPASYPIDTGEYLFLRG
jgi:hypothetical protein